MQAYIALSGIGLTLLLLACSPGGDARSGEDERAAPPPSRPAAADSSGTRQARPLADTAASSPALAEVLAQAYDSLTAIRGVVGVDSVACDAGMCIRITVTRRTQSLLASLPASIDGYQVVVAERRSGH